MKKRDDHLRGEDFFNVARYPEITFVSKKWAKSGRLLITGDLSMLGNTREMVLSAAPFSQASRDPWGKIRRATSATAQLNRKDFGMTWNKALDAGGVTIGEEVTIELAPLQSVIPEKAGIHVLITNYGFTPSRQ